jgi:hypothetical protein
VRGIPWGTIGPYLLRDHLASIRRVTNGSGVSTENNLYATFGEPVKRSNDAGDPLTAAPATQKSYIGERY